MATDREEHDAFAWSQVDEAVHGQGVPPVDFYACLFLVLLIRPTIVHLRHACVLKDEFRADVTERNLADTSLLCCGTTALQAMECAVRQDKVAQRLKNRDDCRLIYSGLVHQVRDASLAALNEIKDLLAEGLSFADLKSRIQLPSGSLTNWTVAVFGTR